jgi:DNA repair exonuclease SbcCD ATPase subunit
MNLSNIEKSIKSLEDNVSSLKGKISLLETQYSESSEKISLLKESQITNAKAIELLNLVQKVTKDLIKDTFETITTKALQFIHQDDSYRFELDFGRRGNTPELSFNIKTPDMQEAHDIISTRGGGSADIISIALRFVLLEVSKTEGFVFFDEPFKHLDSPETIQKAIEFIKEIQKESNRQIFIISHEDEVIESIPNPIVISNNTDSRAKTETVIEPEVKKRGRPKKNV